MRCEARTLDDIRALGGNDLADERKFEAAARLSEINLALYRAFAQPAVQAMVSPPFAEAMRRLHPLRLSYEMFGAEATRGWPGSRPRPSACARAGARRRRTIRSSPPQALVSQQIVEGLEAWRDGDGAAVGGHVPRHLRHAGAAGGARHRHRRRGAAAQGAAQQAARGARRAPDRGASRRHDRVAASAEALVRALLWVGMARNAVDERGFAAITRLRDAHAASRQP